MSESIPQFAGLSLSRIGDLGVPVPESTIGSGCATNESRSSYPEVLTSLLKIIGIVFVVILA